MTRPAPIVHASIAAARCYYKLRRNGVPSAVAHARVSIVTHLGYWDAAGLWSILGGVV